MTCADMSTSHLHPTTLASLEALPTEVLLEIVPHVPFTSYTFHCLCLTCSKIYDLLRCHERGLVSEIKALQFDRLELLLFPDLSWRDDWRSLSELGYRLGRLQEIHTHWLKIVNHGLELQWLKGRWENIHKAGLLLLYRLQDVAATPSQASSKMDLARVEEKDEGACDTAHAARIALLNSLPASSLACLLFKLISSIKILRVYGPNPINAAYARDDVLMRSDVELALEELLLQHGPDFFVAMLQAGNHPQGKSATAVRALDNEVAGMIERQLPLPSGATRPPTLISSLRRALACAAGCEVHHTVSKMWEILSCTGFDEVGMETMGRIVRGEKVEGGMKVSILVPLPHLST